MHRVSAMALIGCLLMVSALTGAAPAGAASVTLGSRLSTGGLGPLKIGMSVSAAGDVVGSGFDPTQLSGESPADNACFWGGISPKRYGVSVLGTGFRIAVVFVSKRSVATTRDIRVGDSVAKLFRAYGSGLHAKPNFYSPSEIHYELAVGNRKLLFYVSRAGKVSGMQAGRKPEIDYVEGCA
ncbi:MAG: hypothetical protein JWR30_3752 [Conexibacter sp.]|nr:hypothetical protein [Conexibacter sp.]